MNQIRALRTACAASIAADARFDGIQIATHGGTFDSDEIVRYARKSPRCIVLAVLGDKIEWQGGDVHAHVTMGAAVIALDQSGVAGATKDHSVLDMADALQRFLTGFGSSTFYGLDWLAAPDPRTVKGENVYSEKLDKMGVAMWTVTWQQAIDLRDDAVVPDDLLLLSAKYDLSPRNDGADLGDQIEAENLFTPLDPDTL